VTTGNNYTGPATERSDAFVAFDLASGKILWSRQTYAGDDWNTSCRLPDQVNCTNKDAPDFDFSSPPILVSLPNGRRALVAGEKSGMVHAIDPDREGQILWQQRVGKGGINGGVQWGSATDASNVYVALSDLGRINVPNSQATVPDPEEGGGMFALRLDTGKQVWHTPPPRACRHARIAAVRRSPQQSVRYRASRSPERLTDICARIRRLMAPFCGTSTRSDRRRPSTACPRAAARSTSPALRSVVAS
jgi:polyvinyl alcohol dehydrogenase (cytochrome)